MFVRYSGSFMWTKGHLKHFLEEEKKIFLKGIKGTDVFGEANQYLRKEITLGYTVNSFSLLIQASGLSWMLRSLWIFGEGCYAFYAIWAYIRNYWIILVKKERCSLVRIILGNLHSSLRTMKSKLGPFLKSLLLLHHVHLVCTPCVIYGPNLAYANTINLMTR